MKAPGSALIRISSITIILFSAFIYINTLTMLFLIPYDSEFSGELDVLFVGLFIIMVLVCLILATYLLIIGILGIKNAVNPEKATLLIILSLIITVFQAILAIATLIISVCISFYAIRLFLCSVFGLAVYIVYLVGALKNKASFKAYCAANENLPMGGNILSHEIVPSETEVLLENTAEIQILDKDGERENS